MTITTELPLRHDQIDLWLVFSDEIQDGSLLSRYRLLLTPEERLQEKRFLFEKDQHRYLLTRALVRTTNSRYVPDVSPAAWRFDKNEYGRPLVANDSKLAQQLAFNISHTMGLIVLAVTADAALGVDVENLRRREVSTGIAERFFAPVEAKALNSLEERDRPQRFFEYWTLKESYIKARGMGLSIPLDQFSFSFPTPKQVEIEIEKSLVDPMQWHFWQLQITADLLAAVCVAKPEQKYSLQVKKIVPLVSDEEFQVVTLRESN